MEVLRRIVFGSVLLITILSVASQPCHATAITFDLKNVPWLFDGTSESFDLKMQGARGDLTFVPTPFATIIQSVPSAFSSIEKRLTVTLEDRVDWQLAGLQADLRFNGGSANVTFKATEVRTFNKDLSNTPSIAAIQSFWIGPDRRPSSDYISAWGGAQNVNITTSQYQFTFNNDSKLFSAATKIPAAFLVFDTPGSNNSYYGGGGFGLFADAPEPASLILTAAGLGALAFVAARRKRRQTVTAS
jgi:hypothetical protein